MFQRVVFSLSFAFLSFVGLAAVFAAGGKAKDNTLSPREKKEGWRLLFDGKSTKGWRGFKKPDVSGWLAKDGVLTTPGKSGDLITADQYQDFELSIDWKISVGGNSGLIYRSTEDENRSYLTGPEYQLIDDEKHADAGKNAGAHSTGALYDMIPPATKATRPAGEWNQSKIVVHGNHVEHWLNGDKVVEAEIGSDDWQKLQAASKWAKADKYAKMPKGHIVLQDHGDAVEFKNIKLRAPGGAKGGNKAK